MNPEKELNRICELNNGTFTKEDFKVEGELGAFIFVSDYKLEFIYNGCQIDIIYNFGNSDTATFKVEIKGTNKIPSFHLTTIDHFTKLISFRKYNWRIKSRTMSIKREIEKLLRVHQLDKLIYKTAFAPSIQGIDSKDSYTIHTFFSLVFERNIESMEQIIEFHKEFIDLLKQKYR